MNIKNQVDSIYKRFHQKSYLELDPLHVLIDGLNPNDAEVLSFIMAGLSYGRVEQIVKSFKNLLFCLEKLNCKKNGEGLSKYLLNSFKKQEASQALKGWVHRLNTEHDIVELFSVLHNILNEKGSLCAHFQESYLENPEEQISKFGQIFRNSTTNQSLHKKWKGTGASWFAPDPKDGSTCKRLMMWFRWMIRDDRIDLGLWQRAPLINTKLPRPSPERLFYPVDTHIFRWGKNHNVIKSSSMNWKSVREITDVFKKLSPEDPVKYDFSLCTEGKLNFRDSFSLSKKVTPKKSRASSPRSLELQK